MSNQYNTCGKENILSQLLKVQAQIKVTPLVKHGRPKVYCISSGIKPNSQDCDYKCDSCDDDYESAGTCKFTLTQLIKVEIPISFDADVDIKKGVLCCGKPEIVPEFIRKLNEIGTGNDIGIGNQIYILMKRQF